MPTNWPTYAWYTAAALLGALGLYLLIRYVIGDRSKGRRRCPKCWYDMSATPGLTCSECGKTARTERATFRTRRSPRRLLVGMCMCALAVGCGAVPFATAKNWRSAIPTVALILWVSPDDVTFDAVGYGNKPTLVNELYTRWKAGRLDPWEYRFLLNRCTDLMLNTREKWPNDVPVVVYKWNPWIGLAGQRFGVISVDGTIQRGWKLDPQRNAVETLYGPNFSPWYMDRSGEFTLEGQPADRRLRFTLEVTNKDQSQPFWTDSFKLPVHIGGTVDDHIRPVQSAEIDEYIRNTMRVAIEVRPNWTQCEFHLEGKWPINDVAIGVIIELVRDGQVHLSAKSCLTNWPIRHENSTDWLISVSMDDSPHQELKEPGWILRIRGDPIVSLADLQAKTYWAGEFEVPLSDVLRDPPPGIE